LEKVIFTISDKDNLCKYAVKIKAIYIPIAPCSSHRFRVQG